MQLSLMPTNQVSAVLKTATYFCAIFFLLSPLHADAQVSSSPIAGTVTQQASTTPGISYVGGQLRIEATDVTLAEVLRFVVELTGVKIDIPVEANVERMPTVKIGPASARDVLASLLSGSRFNYLIQSSDDNPEKIQAVVIMPMPVKGKGGAPDAVMQASVPTNNLRAAQMAARAAEASSSQINSAPPAPQVASASPEAAPSVQDQLAAPAVPQPLSSQLDTSNSFRPGALSPPPVLSQQSMSQQLQQMYQQRMQMMPQTASVPLTPATH